LSWIQGRLRDQEQAADEQDQVAPRPRTHHREPRLGQAHHPADREQEQDAHEHRAAETQTPCASVLRGSLPTRIEEDHVVDPEHDPSVVSVRSAIRFRW
jgi:hypothetical protein